MKNKLAAMLSMMMLLFSFVPAATSAAAKALTWQSVGESAVEGTDYAFLDGNYYIYTAAGLAWFAGQVNDGTLADADATLAGDLDLSGVVDDSELTESNSWIPIGSADSPYTGEFQGGGFTISGMKIFATEMFQGLFGTIGEEGLVTEVTVADSQIVLDDSRYVPGSTHLDVTYYGGGIAAHNRGTISYCASSAAISGSTIGGIAGLNNGVIDHCTNTGALTGVANLGGIAGDNQTGAEIKSSVNSGTITGSAVHGSFLLGGIAGSSDGTITDCSNAGTISAQFWGGGIAGCVADGSVLRCRNTGDLILTYTPDAFFDSTGELGGIAGRLVGDKSAAGIEGCYNAGNIFSDMTEAEAEQSVALALGGIIGESVYGKVETIVADCINDGSITAAALDFVGGIAGSIDHGDGFTQIVNCVNNGAVTAKIAGGIVGRNVANVENSYNTAPVSGSSYAGGIVGGNTYIGSGNEIAYAGVVRNCYNVGTVTGSGYTGSLAGKNTDAVLEACYYPEGQSAVGGGADEATECAAFDEENLVDGAPLYRVLNRGCDVSGNDSWSRWMTSEDAPAVFAIAQFASWQEVGEAAIYGHDYTLAEDVYYIYTPAGLAWFAGRVNSGLLAGADAALANDIDLSTVVPQSNNWIPIGTEDNPFCGSFDGQNYTVAGMYIHCWDSLTPGLFGCIGAAGEVKNLGVLDSAVMIEVELEQSYEYVGLLASTNEGSITNCYTDASSVINVVKCYAGGIAGRNYGLIEGCRNAADISARSSSIGGICGVTYDGRIKNCSNSGKIQALVKNSNIGRAGGISALVLASMKSAVIINCYNTGEIFAYLYAGGIVATGVVGMAPSTQRAGRFRIINCYNLGDVTTFFSYAGGICGDWGGTELNNCYNRGKVTFEYQSRGVGSIIGNQRHENSLTKNCYYLSGSSEKAVGSNNTAYTPEGICSFDANYMLTGTNKSLCDVLNYNVLFQLREPEALGWVERDGHVQFADGPMDTQEKSMRRKAFQEKLAPVTADVVQTAESTKIEVTPSVYGSGTAYAALYKDKVLIALDYVAYALTDAGIRFDIHHETQPDEIKVFMWDSGSPNPLCEAFEQR